MILCGCGRDYLTVPLGEPCCRPVEVEERPADAPDPTEEQRLADLRRLLAESSPRGVVTA